jgi:DNA topoisomerase-1
MGDLKKLKLSEDEAAALLNIARQCADESRLRTYGVPLVSLKKYRDAGFSSPEDFCFIHPAYLSTRTGISLETVQKHVAKVCEGMGVRPPGRITKAAFESGRARLLALPGLGEASYERLLRAGIIDSDGLRRADPEDVAAKTGIAAEKIRAWAEAAEVEG